MKRITTDNVCEMGIVGLAHNCCYIGKDGYARYRDFDMDIDARELAKELLKELAKQDVDFESDGDFDEWIGDRYGEDGIGTIHGLIAMFYQNIWSMAELRENLKRYEDLEEQGRLVVLPCAVSEEVEYKSAVDDGKARKGKVIAISMLLSESVRRMEMQVMIESGAVITFEKNDFEKGVLRRGKEESEAALEKMGGGEK